MEPRFVHGRPARTRRDTVNAMTPDETPACDVRALGFEYCSFGLRIPFPVTNPKFMLQSNDPEPWVKRYVSQNYVAVEMTARERESLQWSAAGKTYVEIGKIMHVDERTVKFHLVNAMRKLNATNKTEAAVKAAIPGRLF
ncbi:hypothetical protein WS75_14200 [Burkholderia sp. FL-7-2-10-S1-D7]|nr:hypothetical protein WS75_14200 [Burkholderia sp. FL-7-2-10-S1-D7]